MGTPFWYSESLVHVFYYSTIIFKKISLYIQLPNIYVGVAAKDLRFSLDVSIVRAAVYCIEFIGRHDDNMLLPLLVKEPFEMRKR